VPDQDAEGKRGGNEEGLKATGIGRADLRRQ
jgi:hypothetical protein